MAKKSGKSKKKSPPKRSRVFWVIWSVIVGIGVILALIVSFINIRDEAKTQKEKYEEEVFVTGELNPPKMRNKSPQPYTVLESSIELKRSPSKAHETQVRGIFIKDFYKKDSIKLRLGFAEIACYTDDLVKGVKIENPIRGLGNNSALKDSSASRFVTLIAKDSRLYVSSEFWDLQKEEIVGTINFNKWKLYRPNLLDYNNDDLRLEVRDKQNNIVFSIAYSERGNVASIMGYFVTESDITIISGNDEGVRKMSTIFLKSTPGWKASAAKRIKEIPSIF